MIGRGSCVWSQLLSLGCLCASMGLSLAMPAGWAVASARAPRVLGSADRRAQRAVEARSDGSQGELETRRRFTSFASSSSRGNVVSRSGRNGRATAGPGRPWRSIRGNRDHGSSRIWSRRRCGSPAARRRSRFRPRPRCHAAGGPLSRRHTRSPSQSLGEQRRSSVRTEEPVPLRRPNRPTRPKAPS
jgi:hypothetical protein